MDALFETEVSHPELQESWPMARIFKLSTVATRRLDCIETRY